LEISLPTDHTLPPDNNASRTAVLLGQFWSKLFENIIGIVVVALGGLALIFWNKMSATFHDYMGAQVISYVEEDLNKGDNSILLKTVPPKLTDRFGHIFGEIATGSLYLTDSKVDLFVPPGHDGRIRIQVVSNLPDNAEVVVQGPKGIPKGMPKLGEYSWPLSTFLTPSDVLTSVSAQGTETSEPETKYFSSVYTLTFVLRQIREIVASTDATATKPPVGKLELVAPVQIKYIVVIYPPLQSEDLP
jgi:hypothetical protein